MAGYSVRNLLVIAVLIGAAAWQYFSGNLGQQADSSTKQTTQTNAINPSTSNSAPTLAQLRKAANDPNAKFWTTIQGTVIKNLKDDNEGDRHQKFLVELAPDLTLLVSHNIDVASRVSVSEGDRVQVRGEYVWNNRGGVLHWTHHDPNGRKAGGWIEVKGKRYD